MDLKNWGRRGSHATRDSDGDLESKMAELFDNQTLFERLPSEPVWRKRLSEKAKKNRQAILNGISRTPTSVKMIIVGAVALNTGFIYWQVGHLTNNNVSKDINQVAGVSTDYSTSDRQKGSTSVEPSFKVITPSGVEQSSGVERKAPSGDALYTFKSKIGETAIEVTEQSLPDYFKVDQDNNLQKFADSNYLKLLTQIDQQKIFAGVNEKSGVQTLLFIKSDLLIFIKADRAVDTNLLTGYILNLR
ncbi:hypothetical protein KC930_02350 [Candidatus Saccharibacteria bacterium]|nr:hypothetical protein [Candidatus Saccharibacteria bacterium]